MFPIFFNQNYNHPVPENHRFPMIKYDLLPKQLVHQGIVSSSWFVSSKKAKIEDVYLAHNKDYADKFVHNLLTDKEARKIGFVQDKQIVERELTLVQSTIEGAIAFLQHSGIAFNIAGGTHHAHKEHGEGFCMLNDQAIAAMYLLKNTAVERILIVDLDVHQGNGTANIFANNPSVFTFSMHGKNNYPFKKEKSDLDIELEDQTTDEEYMQLLINYLPKLIEEYQPQFIFYQAGVDILATDKLGKLNISEKTCADRDAFVFQQCKLYKIPVQCSMGGGYSPKLSDILNAHCNTYARAVEIFC